MALISFLLVSLTFVISIINYISIRKPKNQELVSERVTVLLPARNEEDNIAACIQSLRAQVGISHLTFIVINDQSTDQTLAHLERAISDDSRFKVLDSPALKAGWLGKVSALQNGFERADCDYLATIDADVRLKPSALVSAVNELKRAQLDFISPYPRQIARTFGERLIQPLLHWSWMSTVILTLAEKFPTQSTGIANGQFFVARKTALDEVGGFESVSHKILDDIEIARTLIRNKFRGIVAEGSHLAETRMYQNFNELKEGYGKSLWKAFGGIFGTSFALIFIFLTAIYPICLAAQGYLIGIITYLLSVLTRQLSALRARSNPIYAFLHPLSAVVLIYLISYSWRKLGSIQWKGRAV
jgi:cellulose synthase/poly-beta-1,6-N-acetylglucosamine synthase-like glycosyltransferase